MIHLTSAWSKEFQPLADLTWTRSKVPYAGKHGYKCRFYVHDAPEGIQWNRVECWLDTLNKIPEGDYMFWTGCDALISRADKKADDFVTGGEDFCFSIDGVSQAVFADCFLLKSNDRTKEMLKRMLESRLRERGGNEQDAFAEYLYQGKLSDYLRDLKFRSENSNDIGVQRRAQKLLSNSPVSVRVLYGNDDFCGDGMSYWADGTLPDYAWWNVHRLVFHMGGKSLPFRIRHMAQYNAFR